MKDSVTYQAIIEEGVQKGLERGRQEGRQEGILGILLRQGEKRFGAADSSTRKALEGIADLDRLDRLADRVNEAADWHDWLATP